VSSNSIATKKKKKNSRKDVKRKTMASRKLQFKMVGINKNLTVKIPEDRCSHSGKK
jgi:hypothetical protein